MSKKNPSTSANAASLGVLGITIRRPVSVSAAARGVAPPINLAIEVENAGSQPLFVYAKQRGYAYDSGTHVLSVQLAEPPQVAVQDSKKISVHPRTPVQVTVAPKSRAQIKIIIPPNVPRVVPGKVAGSVDVVPEPIGQVDQVDLRIQYAVDPIKYAKGEAPRDFQKRLLEHGDVLQTVIKPTVE